MILLYALIVIFAEALTEGFLKRYSIADWLFDIFIQWVLAIFLFGIYFILAYNFNGYFLEVWKIIVGMILVRFALFDVIWNIANGQRWNYYGTTKLYDRIMTKLGSFGWMAKGILGFVGICMLLGIESMQDLIKFFVR